MYEFYVNVAYADGFTFDKKPKFRFMFRTDWMQSEHCARSLCEVLRQKFPEPEYKVTVSRRSATREEINF